MHPLARTALFFFSVSALSLSNGANYSPNDFPVYDYEDDDDLEKKLIVLRQAVIAWPIIYVVIAALLLAALGSLFPLNITVTPTQGRRRRSALDDGSHPLTVEEWKENLNKIYVAAMRGEECMERMLCEMGGVNKQFYKERVHKIAKLFVPRRLGKYLDAYKITDSKMCSSYKCSKSDRTRTGF